VTPFASAICLGLLTGILYKVVGKTDYSDAIKLQSHFSGIAMALIMTMFGTGISLLLNVTLDRVIFLREYTTSHFNIVSYCASKFVVEAIVTLLQILCESALDYNLMGLQRNYTTWFLSTSLGSSVRLLPCGSDTQ
jgi:hypothetical protein